MPLCPLVNEVDLDIAVGCLAKVRHELANSLRAFELFPKSARPHSPVALLTLRHNPLLTLRIPSSSRAVTRCKQASNYAVCSLRRMNIESIGHDG